MNHRPFEDWLLAEEPLTTDQKMDLQGHLNSCTSCKALAETNLALRTKRMVSPAPGFGTRFQANLAARRAAQKQRTFLGILVLVVGAVVLSALFLYPYLQWVFASPTEVFVTWITTVSLVVSSLLAYGKVGSVMLRVASGFIPLYFWVAVFTLAGLAGLLWVVSIRKFAPNYEGVKK